MFFVWSSRAGDTTPITAPAVRATEARSRGHIVT
jgi:hypothetical protein